MKDLFWVYSIENKLNGKKYIGKAKNPRGRWLSHLSVSKKESKYQKYIHRAIKKYGQENFWFRCIVFCFSEKEALEVERELIAQFHTTDPCFGYNLTKGGEGESGYKHTPETKKELSRLASLRTGESNPFYGKTHTEGSKEKIRSRRRKLTDEQVIYIRNSYESGKLVKDLSKELNISVSHIYDIINNKYWSDNEQ